MSIHNLKPKLTAAEDTLVAQLTAHGANDAATRFSGAGLPTRRVESYHYTDLKMLLRDVPELAGAADSIGAPEARIPGAYRVLTVNGVVQEIATAPAGVIAGVVKGSVLTERDDVIVRLNTALTGESLRLDLNQSVDPVIHIDHRHVGPAGHINSGTKIFIAPNSSATIIETLSGSDDAHMINHASYVAVGDGAEVTHIVVDLSGKASRYFGNLEYELGADVKLLTLLVHSGADLSRTQIFGRFTGGGSHADFTGLNLVNDGQHMDVTLDIAHAVPNTTSTETFKSVVRGRSKAVFQGKILVAQDAQKTDAKMMSQGLMLSDEAEILAKPELEIFADDVVCGHGATCGQIDADSLFYLMSRGIARADAEAMLVRAFLEELFDPIEDEELHEVLSGIAEEWLVGQKG